MGGATNMSCSPPWKIYENLKEIVYVIDVETYKIVFLNKFGREKFCYKPEDDDMEKKFCYQILQNLSEPCSFCPNSQLKLNEFYEWKYYNPVLKNKYLLKDTLLEYEGKIYKMEITINGTEDKLDVSNPEQELYNEIIIKEFLKNIHTFTDVNLAINNSLKFLGETFQSERAYIFEDASDKNYIDNTYEWCKRGIEPHKNNLQNIYKQDASYWYEMFLENENIIIENLSEIKGKYQNLYNILAMQDIHSLVVSPLVYENEIIGFFGIDNPPKSRLKYLSKILSILSHFIVSALKRRDLIKELNFLSYYDKLTGAKNRNAFNKFLAEIGEIKSLGIVYGDVTGLKEINDTFGHMKGDKLLQTAYKIIESIFKEFDIYRIGGDEFIIFCKDIGEEKFIELISKLREYLSKEDKCKIAIGEVWTCEKKEIKNIDSLIDRADKKMYLDKKGYYSSLKKYGNSIE